MIGTPISRAEYYDLCQIAFFSAVAKNAARTLNSQEHTRSSMISCVQRTSQCPSGHVENRSPQGFVKVVKMSEPQPIVDWKPIEGRNYVDILNFQTARISGIQIEHLGSGLYIDRRTRKKYDYEEDSKGKRHYYEVIA